MISVRVNEIVVGIHYFYIQALFDVIFYVQSILQKLAIMIKQFK